MHIHLHTESFFVSSRIKPLLTACALFRDAGNGKVNMYSEKRNHKCL